MDTTQHQVTRLLADAGRGRREAWDQLAPLIFDELRKVAAAEMSRERAGHTLQPTALVNEAYLKLVNLREAEFNSRTHFFGAAATVMRRILVDHARAKRAAKRGGGAERIDLDDALLSFEERSTDVLGLDAALSKLAEMDAEHARIVELRFFGGLSVEETAIVLNTSASSVERGWRIARAWLMREIGR
jgi:RNA polymerase sigma factor (TIGR02999 family)